MKTIALPEDLHKELMKIKLDNGSKNVSEIIKALVAEHQKQKFLEASKMFRKMLKDSGESFDEFLKEARKVKEEVVNEQFPDL